MALCKTETFLELNSFFPKVYIAAKSDGAIFTSIYFFKKIFPNMWDTLALTPSASFELLDLAMHTSAPAFFAIIKSKNPAAFDVILNT